MPLQMPLKTLWIATSTLSNPAGKSNDVPVGIGDDPTVGHLGSALFQ